MAATALEEKINKIRQQNEEIRRRHEEVEQDKKKAAESNALVQMVPSADWPERKEPPEFSNPPRNTHKQKASVKDHGEQPLPHHMEGRKGHSFAQGEGPPPDPKYNFLADSDREELSVESMRENSSIKGRGRSSRGNMRKRGGGRDGLQKDGRMYSMGHRDGYQPEYDAWRAERNRIDEDRISRQRTAEGNWRREWDNNKIHIMDEVSKRETRGTFGDVIKRDKHFDNRHHSDGHEHINYNRGGAQRGRGSQRNFHNSHDHRYGSSYDQHGRNAQTSVKNTSHYVSAEERTVVATDKSIKVTLNQNTPVTKGTVTSVKVNSPNIAGTGRVGPRQRTRVTYSSHSDFDANTRDSHSFARQKSFEDKAKAVHYGNAPKVGNVKRTPSQKKKESRSPYAQRKECKKEESKEQKEPPKSPHRQANSEMPMKIESNPTDEPAEVRRESADNADQSEERTQAVNVDTKPANLAEKDTESPTEAMGDLIAENVPSGKEVDMECVAPGDQQCIAESKPGHSNCTVEKDDIGSSIEVKEEVVALGGHVDVPSSFETVKNTDDHVEDEGKSEEFAAGENDVKTQDDVVNLSTEDSLPAAAPEQANCSETHRDDNAATDKQAVDGEGIKDDDKERKVDKIPIENCDSIERGASDSESRGSNNNPVADENMAKTSTECKSSTCLDETSTTNDNSHALEKKEEGSGVEVAKEIVEINDNAQVSEEEVHSEKGISEEAVETAGDCKSSDGLPASPDNIESCNVADAAPACEAEPQIENKESPTADNDAVQVTDKKV